MTPPLTTVHHPMDEIGSAATQLLIQQIERKSTCHGTSHYEESRSHLVAA